MDKRNPGAIDYFHRRIDDFDSIYRESHSGLRGFLNRTLRASVRERFRLAFDILGDMSGRSVLDIGCGTGRYMFEAVRRGASELIGLDAAAGAIDAARKLAHEQGMEKKVEFVQADFMDFEISHPYNVVFAVGYFDYILEPARHLEKMQNSCDQFFFATFPRVWHPMTPVRKLRLALNHCPVRFYTRKRVMRLLNDAGFKNYEIRHVARDFIAIVRW
jgi:2-polyprenyl-3-methyl-5-hydroxy-6-metoxy-1,4-benzoquinol methylase